MPVSESSPRPAPSALLGSIRELVRLTRDSAVQGASCTTEDVSGLFGSKELTETMEGVLLERTGETMWLLPPQETMWLAICRSRRDRIADSESASCILSLLLILPHAHMLTRRPSHVAGAHAL